MALAMLGLCKQGSRARDRNPASPNSPLSLRVWNVHSASEFQPCKADTQLAYCGREVDSHFWSIEGYRLALSKDAHAILSYDGTSDDEQDTEAT